MIASDLLHLASFLPTSPAILQIDKTEAAGNQGKEIQWSHWHLVGFVFASIIFTPYQRKRDSAGSAQFVCVFIFSVCLADLLTSL